MHKRGFTLIEVMIVVAIIALLVVALTFSMRFQRQKAEDARAKADLDRLKIAFEDYYSDNNCYPPAEWFDESADCGSPNLQPYLNNIPCDRRTQAPYVMEYDSAVCPSWYKLYTTLANTADPQVVELRSTTEGSTLGNYGISSSNTIVKILYSEPSTPTVYWCSASNNCTEYNPSLFSCSPSYNDPDCTGSSGCASAGSCTPI